MADDPDLLTIGDFARAVGLTASALRHYDECGLLIPARTDAIAAADEEWRALYGASYKNAVTNAIERADDYMHSEFGVNMRLDSVVTWNTAVYSQSAWTT